MILSLSGSCSTLTTPEKYDVLSAQAYPLVTKTGEKKDFAYSWNWAADPPRHIRSTEAIKAGSFGLPGERRGWIAEDAAVEDSFGAAWFGPDRFPAKDGFVSAFMALFLAMPAPPPPHPWSKFRIFPLVTGFLTQTLSTPFVEYKKGQPDAHAMLIERSPKGNYVYGSTTGAQIVPERCQGANFSDSLGLFTKDGCHLQLSDMSLELKDAYAYLADKAFGDFHTTSLNGDAHFLRRQAVIHDWEIVWIKSTAAVDSEVQKALRLLIMFTLLVLLFDVAIAASEVFFIALPLAAVAQTVGHVGEMRIEQASEVLREMLQRRVMLREMVTVVSGLTEATKRLEEFRPSCRRRCWAAMTRAPAVSQHSFFVCGKQVGAFGGGQEFTVVTRGRASQRRVSCAARGVTEHRCASGELRRLGT